TGQRDRPPGPSVFTLLSPSCPCNSELMCSIDYRSLVARRHGRCRESNSDQRMSQSSAHPGRTALVRCRVVSVRHDVQLVMPAGYLLRCFQVPLDMFLNRWSAENPLRIYADVWIGVEHGKLVVALSPNRILTPPQNPANLSSLSYFRGASIR